MTNCCLSNRPIPVCYRSKPAKRQVQRPIEQPPVTKRAKHLLRLPQRFPCSLPMSSTVASLVSDSDRSPTMVRHRISRHDLERGRANRAKDPDQPVVAPLSYSAPASLGKKQRASPAGGLPLSVRRWFGRCRPKNRGKPHANHTTRGIRRGER